MTDTKEIDLSAELKFAVELLARMPKRRQRILLMQVMEGASYSDIATRLRLSRATVRRELLKAFQVCSAHGKGRPVNRERAKAATARILEGRAQ